ncbi:cytochrome C biogenesis protein [bacterium]|nr:cytochrome C biogenesis protein [bacterium]
MADLLALLNRGLEAGLGLGLAASLVWGVLSVALSPCHLSSIPLIVGFLSGHDRTRRGEAFLLSLLFSLGIFLTILLFGAVTAGLGRMAGDIGPAGYYLLALLLAVMGLYLLDVIPLPQFAGNLARFSRRGPLSAILLGVLFGIALGPCTFAFMAPVLGIAFGAASSRPYEAFLLVSAYGVGHCLLIVLAGASIDGVQRYLNWNSKSKGTIRMRQACGALLLVFSLLTLHAAPAL